MADELTEIKTEIQETKDKLKRAEDLGDLASVNALRILLASQKNEKTELKKELAQAGVGANIGGHLYNAVIINSKLRKCCRFRVFQLAEKHHGVIRNSVDSDGISYLQETKNLNIQLVFYDINQAFDFQSDLRRIPSHYRKRKPLDDSAILDIRVEDQPIVAVVGAAPVKRMFESDYEVLGENAEPSELCDGESVVGSSHTEVVNLTEEVKLQLLDKEDGHLLYKTNPERCHLMSATYDRYKNNSDNVLYMSRFLHCHFDSMNKVDGIPTFAIEYVRHHPDVLTKSVNGKDWLCYETTVKVVFRTESDKNHLCVHFKDYVVKSDREIEIIIHVKNPVGKAGQRGLAKGFKEFAEFKALRTYDTWRSYEGVDGDDSDDDVN